MAVQFSSLSSSSIPIIIIIIMVRGGGDALLRDSDGKCGFLCWGGLQCTSGWIKMMDFHKKKACWYHREVQSNHPPTFPFNCCAGPAMTFENEKFPNPLFDEIDLTNIEWQDVSLNYSIRHLLGSLRKPQWRTSSVRGVPGPGMFLEQTRPPKYFPKKS